MLNIKNELNWKNYCNNFTSLMQYGKIQGLVKKYDEELLNNLRNIYCGGIPATILLLDYNLAQRHCYDRARLISLGFTDHNSKVICADVDGLKYNPKYIEKHENGVLGNNYANHCFLERHEDGRDWVYDTSLGYAIEKTLYYKIQHPEITHEESFTESLDYIYNLLLSDDNIKSSKYVTGIIKEIENNQRPVQECYREQLKKEIELFKRKNAIESSEEDGKYKRKIK